jgi:hypothetical protein
LAIFRKPKPNTTKLGEALVKYCGIKKAAWGFLPMVPYLVILTKLPKKTELSTPGQEYMSYSHMGMLGR